MLDVKSNNQSQLERNAALKEYFVVGDVDALTHSTMKYLNNLDMEALTCIRNKMIKTYRSNTKEFGHNLPFKIMVSPDPDIFPLSGLVKSNNDDAKKNVESLEEKLDMFVMRLLEGVGVDYDFEEFRKVITNLVISNKSNNETKQRVVSNSVAHLLFCNR